MNLSEYAKIENRGGGEYIKFETTGETRYLRFLYESGGDSMGVDVAFYRKYWDDVNKRYVTGTDEGRLMATLKAVEYDADGKNPRLVKWERSAYFCKNVLLPMWKNYPRIIDGVWKITATSPKTLDASYAVFPVISADTIKFPIPEEALSAATQETPASLHEQTESTPTPTSNPLSGQVKQEKPRTITPSKKYWE